MIDVDKKVMKKSYYLRIIPRMPLLSPFIFPKVVPDPIKTAFIAG